MAKTTSHMAVGKNGERIAETYLQSLGYLVYDRNVRLGRDEIDLIAYDPSDKVIVFAEVKSRSKSDPDFQPELNLTSSKKRKMLRAAHAWIDARSYLGSYRIDFIGVEDNCICLHVKALGSEE